MRGCVTICDRNERLRDTLWQELSFLLLFFFFMQKVSRQMKPARRFHCLSYSVLLISAVKCCLLKKNNGLIFILFLVHLDAIER